MWNFKQFGDSIALLTDIGEQLTYNQLTIEAEAFSNATDGRCLIFSLCENSIGSAIGYFSCIEKGIVPALLNVSLAYSLLENLVDTYKPAFLWVPKTFNYKLYPSVYSSHNYKLLATPYGKIATLNDSLALLLTTSGSTGSPKFVRQSYTNIKSNMQSIAKYLCLDSNERPITTLPMNYTYGLSILQSHAYVGATMLLTEHSVTTKPFWEFLKNAQATSFGGVPYTYEMLYKMRFLSMKLPHLKTLTQAGGKLLPSLHLEFANWCKNNGKQFIVMYGQCEATARMAYLPWEKSNEKIGAMGIAIPGGRFVLLDVDETPITKTHVTGELQYYGENVTLGYAECLDDLQKGDERHGMLITGDMAQVDEDGYYTIVGRKKRFLKLFGNRVNLDEVERMLKTSFPTEDIACSGKDDKLVIFATRENKLKEMRTFLISQTGLSAQGFTTQVISNIPQNDAGKIKYSELEKIACVN